MWDYSTKAIINRIELVRQKKGLSRRQLAIAADLPPSTLQSAYERGIITWGTVAKIAEAFDIPLFYFFGFADEYGWESCFVSDRERNNPFLKELGYVEPSERTEPSELQKQLLGSFDLLNLDGQQKAIERVQELTEIPKYQAKKQQ